ncbi:MAG: hypothetical protein H6850_03415 [Alphaproteobacteria bacterium]|nr:MAG: hypothetical protein H6850_03415 [Alphaproteobacteria bacterium]
MLCLFNIYTHSPPCIYTLDSSEFTSSHMYLECCSSAEKFAEHTYRFHHENQAFFLWVETLELRKNLPLHIFFAKTGKPGQKSYSHATRLTECFSQAAACKIQIFAEAGFHLYFAKNHAKEVEKIIMSLTPNALLAVTPLTKAITEKENDRPNEHQPMPNPLCYPRAAYKSLYD